MIEKIAVRTMVVLCSIGILFGMTTGAEARHNGSGRESYSRQIATLDDEVVDDLAVPVLFGVRLSNIVSDFGDPRGGGTRSHEGQDIIAKLGTPIVSPAEAVVTSVGFGESAGNFVYTTNPGGERFRYMHLDEIADLKPGDILKEGDFIGTVGDTGNAKGAGAHLHFEIRTSEPLDPFPRIIKEYSLKEKIGFVKGMFADVDSKSKTAKFLVTTYRGDFAAALNAGYDLPREIEKELTVQGVVDTRDLEKQLAAIIASIPKVVTKDLSLGDQGVEVSLVQLFLTSSGSGSMVTKLRASGATGYYGPVTENAIREYQTENDLMVTGEYDAATRKSMMK